jgi:hypothetical protein
MGRPPIGKRAMTPAERQRRRRARTPLADERADLVAAIKRLLSGGKELQEYVEEIQRRVAELPRLQERLTESYAAASRAMGNLKTIHAEVNDVGWNQFVRDNFGFSSASADALADAFWVIDQATPKQRDQVMQECFRRLRKSRLAR